MHKNHRRTKSTHWQERCGQYPLQNEGKPFCFAWSSNTEMIYEYICMNIKMIYIYEYINDICIYMYEYINDIWYIYIWISTLEPFVLSDIRTQKWYMNISITYICTNKSMNHISFMHAFIYIFIYIHHLYIHGFIITYINDICIYWCIYNWYMNLLMYI